MFSFSSAQALNAVSSFNSLFSFVSRLLLILRFALSSAFSNLIIWDPGRDPTGQSQRVERGPDGRIEYSD